MVCKLFLDTISFEEFCRKKPAFTFITRGTIMTLHIKALLLSSLVLPGLGQLYKGDRLKGIILILLVNLFLLGALFVVLKGLGPAIVAAKLSGAADAQRLLNDLPAKAPVARWLLAGFLGLWLYGAIDAAVRPLHRDTSA